MSKGYWNGQVFEIKNEEKWNNYLAKYFEIEKTTLKIILEILFRFSQDNLKKKFKVQT
tara:strand:+ start:743 stop:916 length:174 start_codon:yes stop_codon:yes gene_type:complete